MVLEGAVLKTPGYQPIGMNLWDAWYLLHDGLVHMFYLQGLPEGSRKPKHEKDFIGHAISEDLVRWKELPVTIGPDKTSKIDDLQPWTGCAVAHNGQFYLYYTMRSSQGESLSQRIGLALSNDLYHWKRYENNPVLVPGDRYYRGYSNPLPRNKVDCRDMFVIPDQKGKGWLGFFATCVPAEEESEACAIGCAHSNDLLKWEALPPAYHPMHGGEIEVPNVFFIDGMWYITALTSTIHGARGSFSDKYVNFGTVYAVSEQPEGPYREIEGDNTLLGGNDISCGQSCNSIIIGDETYLLYLQVTTLSPPMKAVTLNGGRLRMAYSDKNKIWRRKKLLSLSDRLPEELFFPMTHIFGGLTCGRWWLDNGIYKGEARTGWQIADLGIGSYNMEITADMRLLSGCAAGFALRLDNKIPYAKNDEVFVLDANDQCVFASIVPEFYPITRREFKVEYGKKYQLRICIRRPRYELYVDDILILSGTVVSKRLKYSTLSLFIDRAKAEINNLEIHELID